MGTDVERISQSFVVLHEIWATFLEVAIAIWLLERQLSVACVAPVALSLGKFYNVAALAAILLTVFSMHGHYVQSA